MTRTWQTGRSRVSGSALFRSAPEMARNASCPFRHLRGGAKKGLSLIHILQDAQAQRDALTAQVQAQEQENAALAADIAEGATEDKMKEIAQEELGLISPNQRVFSVGN